jgi:hypothetical protein
MVQNKSAVLRKLSKQSAQRDQQNILKSSSARLSVSVAINNKWREQNNA